MVCTGRNTCLLFKMCSVYLNFRLIVCMFIYIYDALKTLFQDYDHSDKCKLCYICYILDYIPLVKYLFTFSFGFVLDYVVYMVNRTLYINWYVKCISGFSCEATVVFKCHPCIFLCVCV